MCAAVIPRGGSVTFHKYISAI